MQAVTNRSFPEVETKILAFWEKHQTFIKSTQTKADNKEYVFFDGPPFATGLPHYGHLLAGTLKDIVPRYWTMRGYKVDRVFGWDCHGLPVEFEVEKQLGLKGRSDIEAYGIAEFNEQCRNIVLRYTEEWKTTVLRMGRWVDFDNGYKTLDLNYMESIWWVIKTLWEKGLVYQGKKIVRYSPRISAVLSNFEANLNYKPIQDPSVTIKFKAENEPGNSLTGAEVSTYFLGWTTTPWTLISNLALTVGPEMLYVKLKDKESGDYYYLAKARVSTYYKSEDAYEIIEEMPGSKLEGMTYEPLFDYFADAKDTGGFRVLVDNFVTADDGTGIVHTAPAFGEDDFNVCRRYDIEPVDPIDPEGKFSDQIKELAGVYFRDANKPVIQMLKAKGMLVRQETITHSYPFCYRSEEPLIFKLIPTWYVSVEKIKQLLIDNNQLVGWIPEHLKDGRFGKWLADARDWAISRNRFWGCPIPIWECAACEAKKCIGSRQELEELSGEKYTDLHRHFIDHSTFGCSEPDCAGEMKRIPEVFDCWFESGSMPYAQHHYPFENREKFETNFPADFIAEGLDQTRGWFYTLNVLSSALFNKPAFKNVIVNGIILAEDGRKMSKRLQNYPDPQAVLEKHGADALRLYLVNSPLLRAENLCFSEEGVKQTVRSVLLPFWNAYSFFVTYAKIDGWQPRLTASKSEHQLDRWIISKLQTLIKQVNDQMESYQLYAVVPALVDFLNKLTNWYVRRSRRRFWAKGIGQEKDAAYHTLYEVLTTYIKLTAPFVPFITEEIFQNLMEGVAGADESVHLCAFPVHDPARIDGQLEHDMQLIEDAVALGRTLRQTNNLKVRQPLASLTVITAHEKDRQVFEGMGPIIQEELNVKQVNYSDNEEAFVTFTAKPNMKVLGPKFGQKARLLMPWFNQLTSSEISKIAQGESREIEGITITQEELLLYRTPKAGSVVETDFGITVVIDTVLTAELIEEGVARELISRVQKARKNANFEVEDHILLAIKADEELLAIIKNHLDYLQRETLADKVVFEDLGPENQPYAEQIEINQKACQIQMQRM